LPISLLIHNPSSGLNQHQLSLVDIKEIDVLPDKLEPAIKSKRWKPESEKEILDFWFKEDIYAFNPDSGKKLYSVDTPPPYLSGPMHLGQFIHYTQIDINSRFRRMQGHEVNFPLGIDRNGLPVEVRVEKDLGLSMHETPRDLFLQKCKEKLDADEIITVEGFKRLGIGFNTYEDEGSYRTDSPRLIIDLTIGVLIVGQPLRMQKLSTQNDQPFCTICTSKWRAWIQSKLLRHVQSYSVLVGLYSFIPRMSDIVDMQGKRQRRVLQHRWSMVPVH
jgi:hypothetical protein